MLQEFKVQSGVYPAEFGRAASQINVSTRSGSNQYHASIYEFVRNDKMDARAYDFTAADHTRVKKPVPVESIRLHLRRSGADPQGLQRP
jgi:hypothetical protein